MNFLLRHKKTIKVQIKLLAGLDRLEGYDPQKGIRIEVPEGTRLKYVLKTVPLPRDQPISYIVNGEKAKGNTRLKDGDEIFCFLPFAGG